MRVMTKLLFVVALLMSAPTALWAQATGQINGIVTDASGAVLPGVTVEATNTGTNAVRTAVTGADGLYTVPLLQPGRLPRQGHALGLPRGPAGRRARDGHRNLARGVPDGSRAGERDGHGRGAGEPGRNRQRHARHRHRPAEGGRPAAQRPQLHTARHAHSRRGRAASGPRRADRRCHARRFRQRHRRLQRERHAQPVQQLPDGRRHQQRHLQHRLRAAAAAGRDSGIQDPHPRLRRRVRAQRRFGRERRDQVGQQHALGRRLGVQSRRRAAGAQLLRALPTSPSPS